MVRESRGRRPSQRLGKDGGAGVAACGPVTDSLTPNRASQGGEHQQQGQHRHVLVQRAVAAGIDQALLRRWCRVWLVGRCRLPDSMTGLAVCGVARVTIHLVSRMTAFVVSRMLAVHLAAHLSNQRSQHHQAHRHQSPPGGMARTKGVGR